MSRLRISTPDEAQLTMEHLYLDLERHIAASSPGLCPVDMQISFLRLCHAQSCGKCVPCRVGLGQLQRLMTDVLENRATMKTLDLIEETAKNIEASADCAIGYDAARMVLNGLKGCREDYISHIRNYRCAAGITQPVPCVAPVSYTHLQSGQTWQTLGNRRPFPERSGGSGHRGIQIRSSSSG